MQLPAMPLDGRAALVVGGVVSGSSLAPAISLGADCGICVGTAGREPGQDEQAS